MRLGVQLYTFRKHIKDLDSFKRVIDFVREIGGDGVEIAGLSGVSLPQIVKPLKDAGVVAVATHSPYARIKDDLDRLIDEHLMLGCQTIGISSMPMEFISQGKDGLMRFIDFANQTAEKLKSSQIFLHYHNHAREFKGQTGQRIFDIMDAEFDQDIKFCLDAFWAYVAKCQPMVALETFSNRIKLIHMKDYKKGLFLPKMVTPGDGIIDYPGLLRAAEGYNVSDALIELDRTKDAFADVKRGMQYLKTSLGDIT